MTAATSAFSADWSAAGAAAVGVGAGRFARSAKAFSMRLKARSMRPMAKLDSSRRSEEHTSELQSLMRCSYAVFCWKKKTTDITPEQQYGTAPLQTKRGRDNN